MGLAQEESKGKRTVLLDRELQGTAGLGHCLLVVQKVLFLGQLLSQFLGQLLVTFLLEPLGMGLEETEETMVEKTTMMGHGKGVGRKD